MHSIYYGTFALWDTWQKVEEATQPSLVSEEVAESHSIAATYTAIYYFLPSHIEPMKRQFPGLAIQLFEMNRESVEVGLLAYCCDLAVMQTPYIFSPKLVAEKLLSL